MKTKPDPSVSAFWESPFPLSMSVATARHDQSNPAEHRDAPARGGGKETGNRDRFFYQCQESLRKIMMLTRLEDEAVLSDRIQELRTELKKIQGALKGIQSRAEKKKAHRHFKPFKKLLKLTKELRTAQAESGIIASHFPEDVRSNSYLYQLYQEKHHKLQSLVRYLHGKKSKKLSTVGKKLCHDVKIVSEKALSHSLQKQKTRLEGILNRDIFKEQRLPAVRKKLSAYCSRAAFLGNEMVPDRWREMLRSLGEWQDLQVAIDHGSKAIYGGNLNAYEAEPLGKLRQQLLQDKIRLYEKIVTTASGYR